MSAPSPQRVLFVASEVAPVIKVGGLADVVGSLPEALQRLGHEARVLIPHYGLIEPGRVPILRRVVSTNVVWNGRQVPVTVEESRLPNSDIVLYLLNCPTFFSGGAVYYEHAGPDGPHLVMERYLFFSTAACQVLPLLGWRPTIVHCHDWHTATLPLILELKHQPLPTVLTIHNMEGQGRWSATQVWKWLGLRGDEHPALALRDRLGNFNSLQMGIQCASVVNTVSPTYAHEVLSKEYGSGLENDCASRLGGIVGILNGIDTALYDPATDTSIAAQYTASTVAVGKLINRRALYQQLGLNDVGGPLVGFVGRLTNQKGADLVAAILPDIARLGGQLVLLGSGLPEVEQMVQKAAATFIDQCRIVVRFDARLAQMIYAASDYFLMPSRFEPCGLSQMISMRYGGLPIVRDTGGLHDTVHDLRTDPHGTGWLFREATPEALRTTLVEALQSFAQADMIQAARRRAMGEDFSWTRAAASYATLYSQAEKNHA